MLNKMTIFILWIILVFVVTMKFVNLIEKLGLQVYLSKHSSEFNYIEEFCSRIKYRVERDKRASTKVMRHLSRLPTMKERINILQAQFLFRSFTLPEYVLLTKLMPYIQHDRHQQQYKLSKSSLWKSISLSVKELSINSLKAIKKQFLQ